MTPTVALTFDDGPSKWTRDIQALLAKHESRATFFVIGNQIRGNEQILRDTIDAGHEIGIHGWDHAPLNDLTPAELRGQLFLCHQAVKQACGASVRWWRSPWGKTPDEALEVLLRAQYRVAPLGIDAYDCERKAGDITHYVLQALGDESIVTLHDGVAPNGNEKVKSRRETVRAVGRILERCRSVTLSELLA